VTALAELAGECSSIVALREKVSEFLRRQAGASRQPPILIQGETGTGKGLLAHALHDAGPRSRGPFVDVNCAAIPEPLLEAELFGFERGAFTDARQAKPGLFQTAHGGTMFLDEIGLLPPSLQSKLLSVLEAGAVRRLGATRTQPVNVWIVAATNEDLSVAVRNRRFRPDLYHRLAVMMFTLPPLRERGRDVLLLAERLLAQFCSEYGLPRKSLDESARALLASYEWPGNIRELSNTIERAVLLSDSALVTADLLHITPATRPAPELRDAGQLEAPSPAAAARMQLLEALTRTSWNISKTATLLGLSRNTVRARIERFELGAPDARHRAAEPLGSTPPAANFDSGIVRPEAPSPGETAAPVTSVRWDRRRVAFLRVALGRGDRAESAPLEWSGLLKVLFQKIQNFDGTVEDVSLDGLEASFGLKEMEDPPRRAAHAGLAIRRELAMARGDARDPAIRIGIHTSEVPVVYVMDAPRIDGQARREAAALLDALVTAAAPGTIVASESVAPFLRRRFALEPGPRPNPSLTLYRVIGHEQFGGTETDKGTRFVGRHQELALLEALLNDALAGRGQLVTIIGDPGMGKSRLAWEFSRSSQAWAVKVIETGSAYATNTPYLPVIELLRRFFGVQPEDGPDDIRARLRAALAKGDDSRSSMLPVFLALLGVTDVEWSAVDPMERRHRTLEAVKRLLLLESRAQPLVLLFEDVHWIDSESQAILDALVHALPAARLLLVVTYRPEYHHQWGNLSYYTQLSVGSLSPTSSRELLEDLVGPDPSLEPVVQRLIDWTDGNPFFLEESVRALLETGVLQGSRGDYRAMRSVVAVEVPVTIEDILATRINRLPAADRALVQSAAAIGTEVPASVLSAIADLAEDALESAMQRLRRAELLYESTTGMGGGFTFKHALTREVAYRTLPPSARRDLHRKIVTALESGSPADASPEQLDRLAGHAVRGELWTKAARYLVRAGDRAMEAAAVREAAEYFEQGLDALHHLPETRQVFEEIVDLRLRLRDALWPQLRLESVFDNLQKADAIAADLGDQRRRGWVACYLCHHFWSIGDLEQARDAGDRALAMAREIADAPLLAETNFYRGLVLTGGGEVSAAVSALSDAMRDLDEALAQPEPGFVSPRFVRLGPVLVRAFLSLALCQFGEFARATAMGEEAIRLADRAGNPFAVAVATGCLGNTYAIRGLAAEASELLETGLQVSRTYEINQWITAIGVTLGAMYVRLDRVEEGVTLAEECVDFSHRHGLRAYGSREVMWLAEAYLGAGRHRDAAATAQRALTLCRQRKERGFEAAALWLVAETAARADSPDDREARSRYEEALSIAETNGMRVVAARCQLGLGRLDAKMGDQAEATTKLAIASEAFRELGMPWPGP
jgi:transcriptional regulator with AAA-type ATPase domain/tetratricopeptide (TPR) repeat protein